MSEFDLNFAPSYIPKAGLQTVPGYGMGMTAAALGAATQGQTDLNQSAVFYSPAKDAYVVGGQEISSRDEAGLLNASRNADFSQPTASPGGDYRPVDTASFSQFIDKIANPDVFRRGFKNFESATAGMGLLGGAGLRFLGAEGVGKGLMDVSARRIQELSPYEMGLEDISGARSHGVTDWFAGVVGQFGPSIVETVLAAAVGAAAGAAAGGGPNPLTAAGGALEGMFGKEVVKQSLLAAAKKKLAGEAVSATEEKLLREAASVTAAAIQKNPAAVTAFGDALAPSAGALVTADTAAEFGQQAVRSGALNILKKGQQQAIAGGAGVASLANSYAMGVSDVYREGIESGSPDRATAAALGIPYAALDLLPEFLLARRVLGDIGANAATSLASKQGIRAKAGELLKRGVKGGLVGAGLEGATEAGQEALLLAANPLVDWNSPEGMSRLLNSFAAGAAIGGPIGSLANLADNKEPANLLKPTQSLDPDEAQAGPPEPPPVGASNLPVAPTPQGGAGPNIPYADYTEVQPENLLTSPQLGLPAPPQAQLASPTMPVMPEDPRVPAFLRARQRRMDMAAQQAPTINVPPTGPDQQGMNPLQRMQMQRAMSQQANLVAQQQPQAPDVSYIPQLGQNQNPNPVVPATVAQAPNPVLAAQQFAQGAVQGAEVSSDVAKFKVGAKAGARVKLRKMTAAQAQKADAFHQWLESQRTDPAFMEDVNAAIQRGDYAAVKQLMDQFGFDPEPPKPVKTKTAKPLKTEAKAKPAKAIKGEALKTEKMRAGSRGVDEAGKEAAPASSRQESPKAQAKPEAAKAEGASVRSKQVEADTKDLRSAIDEVDAGSVSGLSDVFYYAYPEKDENIDPSVTERAREYLDRTTFSTAQRKYLDDFLKTKGKESSPNKGNKTSTTSTQRETQLEKLMSYLDSLVRNPEILKDRVQRMLAIGKAAGLYLNAIAATPGGERAVQSAAFNGKTVGDYFEVDRSGRTPKPRLKIEVNVEDDTYSVADAADARSGSFFRTDGTGSVGTLPLGKVRMLVNSFLSKLHIQPKVHIYANVEDLKARNRSLFDRADKARPAGDFATTEAIGYSFDDQVILFSDYIRTEEQLKFVLAHEAIGHFGLRSVIGPQFSTLLNSIYDKDRRVRAYVARQMELGLGKLEAIEEYLADYAAELDTSLVARIWAALKSALNKIGIHFDDDMSRLLIGHSRIYSRTGSGGFFSARSLSETMALMQGDASEGRFDRVLNAQHLGEQFMDMSDLVFNVTRPYRDLGDFIKEKRIREYTGGTAEGLSRWVGKALEAVQTLNNKATRSEGLTMFYQLFQQQSRSARQYLSKYNQMLKETFKVGTTDQHKDKVSKLLAYGALSKNNKLDTDALDAVGKLITASEFGGNIEVNEELFSRIEAMGMMTPEEFIAGFDVPDSVGGHHTFKLGEHGLTEADLDKDGKVWKMYVEQRKAINRAALDLLLANFNAAAYEQRHTIQKLFDIRTNKSSLADADRETLRKIISRHREIMLENATISASHTAIDPASAAKADLFLRDVTRAMDNEAVLKSWLGDKVDDANTVSDETRSMAGKDIIAGLKSLHDKGYTEKQRYQAQAYVRNLTMLQQSVEDAERLTKRTILSSYVPFKRRGRMQVRLAAYSEDGRRIKLSDEIRGVMPYFKGDSDVILNQYVNELNAAFGNKEFNLKDIDGNSVTVTLRPEKAEAREGVDFEGAINMNEFVYMLQKFDINITPQSREQIVKALTEQNESARSKLMRAGTPGWDKDMIRNTSEYLEAMANTAAKRVYRPQVDDAMNRDALWRGNRQQLDDLKAAYEKEPNLDKRARMKREYDRYAYMYMHSAATGETVEINGKQHPTLGKGERYRNDAKALLHWYSEQTNIYDYQDPLLDSELGAKLKTAVVFSQLGGTIASAAVNTISLLTHTIPWASFYNAESGRGGGFGWGKATRQVWQAISDVKNYKLGDIDVLHQIKDSRSWAKYGLTEGELDFLIDQTESGELQAVLPDALLGTARGKITIPWVQKAAQLWMGPFSYAEKLNRRVTALATYRMEYERATAEGLSPKDATESAVRVALEAVQETQGEYAMYNRPSWSRGNLMSFVFMYKQFPILTVQLLRHMPLKGKLTMLAFILLMSGMKGLPFADDLLDLLDTLLQKLGIKIGSVEAELYEMFDSMIPGSGNIFMRGGLDYWTGATFSTRTGMGDLLPLSGAFKAGADPWREAQNFLGPMAGGLFGYVNSFGAMASMGVDALGGRPSSTSLVDIARQSPVALARALGDAWVYADNGAVVNSQGRVVTSDAGPLILLWRALGFYPAAATRSNDLVRVGKAARDYQLEVSKAFKDAFVKATLSGDKAAALAIIQQVKDWNEDAKGTGLEIPNFRESVNRAVKEAKLPAGARFLKTTPVSMRSRTSDWMRMYDVEGQ